MRRDMSDTEKKNPTCFGKLDVVFPKTENGLRDTPETCLPCVHKTACLRSALEGDSGFKVKEEVIDRAYTSGHIHFLERWSRKKDLQRKLNKQRKDPS